MKNPATLICFLLSITLTAFQATSPTPQALISHMLEAAKKVNTLKFTLVKQERVEGKLVAEKSAVKMQQKPLKIYMKQEKPREGLEILYVAGQNNNEALVQANSFPWKTLSLSPQNSLMRSGQHHTLTDMGFSKILNITGHVLQKYESQVNTMLKLQKTVNWNGLNCSQITLSNPNFKYIDYTVQKNETLLTIANKYKLSEFMILEKNPSVKSYTGVSDGQKIKIPTDYAKEISILIDQKTSLPVVIKVSDDKGLFEQYEYHNLQVNPVMKEAEFTRTYSGYNF